MTETNTQSNKAEAVSATSAPKFAPRTTRRRPGGQQSESRPGGRRPGGRGQGRFSERPKPEFDQKLVNIRRVTRVMAGGRRFSFSVAMLIGDKKGRVGFGLGKSNDTSLAINKALQDAKKNMITIPRTKNMSIPHEVEAKYNASRVWISPNKDKGLVAGSSLRNLFILAGMTDITAKIFSRSKNPINNIRATFKALSKINPAYNEVVSVETKKVEKTIADKKQA